MDPRGKSLDHNLIDSVLWLILKPFQSLWTMPAIVIHEWPVVALFLALKIQMMNFATIFLSATNALILITIMKVRFVRFLKRSLIMDSKLGTYAAEVMVYTANYEPATKSIQCQDQAHLSEEECPHNICQCDRQFIYRLLDNYKQCILGVSFPPARWRNTSL